MNGINKVGLAPLRDWCFTGCLRRIQSTGQDYTSIGGDVRSLPVQPYDRNWCLER